MISAAVPLGSGSDFFLVVPSLDSFDGSYGADSAGTGREPAAAGCHLQDDADACAP